VSSPALVPAAPSRARAVALTAVAVAVAVLGLVWAKWSPYTGRALGIMDTRQWPGTSLLQAGSGEGALARAWDFTWTYTQAVWRALLVALVVSACVDVLVPRRWLLRVMDRRTALGASSAGGLAALPGMMCTCCTAPITVTLRRAGVPTSAALAFWLGNPVLNPAVLVFLALLAPGQWVAVRVVLGVVLVVGVTALLGRLADRRAADVAVPAAAERAVGDAGADPGPAAPLSRLPLLWLRSLLRLAVVLVPEYLAVVFLVGLVGAPLGRVLGEGGALAVLVAAVVGALVVLPTGGEIPVLLGLAAAGASAAVLGALLLALPALSLPSAVMVGRALGWRTTAATGAATIGLAILAGGALALLG
jgi:uncharacterized protein